MRSGKAKEGWAQPGWPWELEAIIFLVYVAIVTLPVLFPDLPLPDMKGLFPEERRRVVQEYVHFGIWREQKDLTWFLVVTPFYVLHLLSGWYASRYFSTPLVHVLTPTIMAMVLYYRLLTQPVLPGHERILISGTPLEAASWVLASVLVTLVLARLRMARYMLKFRGVSWDLTTPTLRDGSLWRLAMQVTPILYPLRRYHLFSEGIVVEGWLYSLAIQFKKLETVRVRLEGEPLASGLVLASSLHHIVDLKLKDSQTHILLSPSDYETFVEYVRLRLGAQREEVRHTQAVLEGEPRRRSARQARKSAFAPGGIYERREPKHGPHAD